MDTLTPDMLAEALKEPEKALLAQVLKTIGQERCAVILADALEVESNGGMPIKSGARRRTAGGTFLRLVRQQCTKEERARLFPYQAAKKARRQALVAPAD